MGQCSGSRLGIPSSFTKPPIPATAYAPTLAVIGPGQICVSQKTADNFQTKIFHGDNLTAPRTTWTLKRQKINTADP